MDGRYSWYNMEKHHMKSPDGEIVDGDITTYMANEKAITPHLQPVSYIAERPFSCPDCEKLFTHGSYLIIHHRSHTREKPFFVFVLNVESVSLAYSVVSDTWQLTRRHGPFRALSVENIFAQDGF